MSKKIYTLDGNNFSTLEGFYDEITNVIIAPDVYWGRNLDAFNDILRGGFGTPDEGFILVWKHAYKSRKDLGYPETLRWREKKLSTKYQNDDPDPVVQNNLKLLNSEIELAKQNRGETLFMTLVDIIVDHPDVELRLE
jgi:RNAse (barnase) inhibitor barstar